VCHSHNLTFVKVMHDIVIKNWKFLCLGQSRLTGGIMLSTCPSVRPLVILWTRYVETIMNRFCYKLAQVIHGAQGWNDSGGQRSRSLDAEVRFGDLAEPSFSTSAPFGGVDFLFVYGIFEDNVFGCFQKLEFGMDSVRVVIKCKCAVLLSINVCI